MISLEEVTLELARLVETGTDWQRRFTVYERLLDAGLSSEEAARIACADLPKPMKEAA